MMPCSLRQATPLALVTLAVLAASCRSPSDQQDAAVPPQSAPQGIDGFFAPQPGESWIYHVEREVPFHTELSGTEKSSLSKRTETGHLLTTQRRRTCAGTEDPQNTGKNLTIIDLYEDNQHRGRELYDINPKGVFSRGWLDATDQSKRHVLKHGVAFAPRNLVAGTAWISTGRDANRLFHFRIIERTNLTVPAGTFETARIQITNSQPKKSLKRTIWFAENVGIVKEESVYYGPNQIRVRERAELTRWILPEEATAQAGTE